MGTTAAVAGSNEPVSSYELRVPLFQSIFEQLDPEQRVVVLDLGPARSGLIERLVDWRCRLDVIGVPDRLAQWRSLEDSNQIETVIQSALPPLRGERTHVVLAWNLLNYLDTARIQILARVLKKRLAPGACLHALIEYSSKQMPALPGKMTPCDAGNLHVEPDHELGQIDTPRFARARLESCLAGMQAERTMLLGNGMQEYLFRLRPT